MTLTSTNLQLKLVCIKKLGAKNVLAFRARGGFIQGDAPYSQLFTLGGADSLRGYEDDHSVASTCTMLHWNSASQSLKRLVAYCSLILVMHGMHQM